MTENNKYYPQWMTATTGTGTTGAEWKDLWKKDFYYDSIVNQSLTLSQQTKKKTEYNQQEITIRASEVKTVFSKSQKDKLFYSPTPSSLLCVLFHPLLNY